MGPELKIDVAEKLFSTSDIPILRNFRLDIAAGSVVALVGPSGVGKSTLLRMIAAIDREYEGTITIDGQPAADAQPAGYVFQDARLLPWLTALDNVQAVSPKTTDHGARQLLARVGLTGVDGLFPRQLSGGMQRRVGLARALSVNPRLLLLDEPFVSIDRMLILELQLLLTDIIEQTNATVILVSHMAEDAAMLADRAIVLADRPARIAADIALDVPRRQRDAATVLEMSRQVAA